MQKQIRIEGDIAYVPLTKGYEAVIDVSDVPLVDQYYWAARINGTNYYAYALQRLVGGKRLKPLTMHRLLTGFDRTDHRDGNGLNNRRKNLRPATIAQNARNCRRPKNNTSGVKGVTWHAKDNRWRAQIKVNGKRVWLGSFTSLDAAATAYARGSAEFHGEFGRLE